MEFGVYVHFPWCRARCRYCAFATSAEPDPPVERWLAGVLAEWRRRRPRFPGRAHSLYVGGGTPSLAPAEALARLVEALPLAPGAEVTVEANPGTLDARGLAALVDAGLTRLSIGVQSFSDERLRALGRLHDARAARRLCEAAAAAPLASWSLDLIWALPGQDVAELDRELEAVEALAPPHVSAYALAFEPGTPLDADRRAGRVRPPDEDRWRALHDRLVERLAGMGLHRYEVSNFARPGHRCVHNAAVWRGGPYAGLGPAAHGFEPGGARTENPADLERWLAGEERRELPSPRQAAVDLLLSGLRHVDGVDLGLLARRTGHALDPALVGALEAAGLLRRPPGRDAVALAPAAFPLADAVLRRLVGALRPAGRPHRPPLRGTA